MLHTTWDKIGNSNVSITPFVFASRPEILCELIKGIGPSPQHCRATDKSIYLHLNRFQELGLHDFPLNMTNISNLGMETQIFSSNSLPH